jgi:ubiquinone biosynthesis protein COQ9
MANERRQDYIGAMADTTDWAADAEARLLQAALPLVPELGWNSRLVRRAAQAVDFSLPEAELLLPGGARDLAALFSYRHDETALAALSAIDPAALKIRERIARGVEAWIEAAVSDEAASRCWMGYLALPQNLALGARLFWASADVIWRWAGDTSTDANHYSKRAILAGLLSSTLALRMSNTPAAAQTHLERGIEAVMAFEKAKARFGPRPFAAAAAETLGRLRYGARAADPDEATPA